MQQASVAILVDIVGSRSLADRPAAQRELEAVFEQVAAEVPMVRSFYATVGDEFQGIARSVADALAISAIARLLMPEALDCRFGIGVGEVRAVDESGSIEDGTAWWRAREAIDVAHARENRTMPTLRTWIVSGSTSDDAPLHAYLLVRDHTIHRMRARDRRVTAGAMMGRSQSELAQQEGVTQSAISQSLARSGGAALAAAQRAVAERA